MVFDRLTELEVKTFYNYAVYVKSDFSRIIIEKCKISKPVETECYGVIPNDSPSGVFNCCVGNYKEEMCHIIIYSIKDDFSMRSLFGACYCVKNIYEKKVTYRNINRLIEKSDGCYVGFFKTKIKAYNEIMKVRKRYVKNLKDKIKSVVKVKEVVREFKEAYAEHKRNKDI